MSRPARRPFRLGMLGLGPMAAAMVRRLLARGWVVTVWDNEPGAAGPLEEAGAKWADSPAAVRAGCDVVLIHLTDDLLVEDACLAEGGLVSAKGAHIVVDFSTTGIELTRELGDRLDVAWLDCPVSGSPELAERGQLTMLAGGTEDLFEWVRPILRELAHNMTLMGPLGAGQTTKLISQAIVGAGYVLMGEILAQVRASGVDGSKLVQALRGGLADSVILQRVFPQVLAADYDPPRGRAASMNKDLRSVRDFNDRHGLLLPVLEVAIDQYRSFAEAGNADADSAAVAVLYEPPDP